MKGEAYIFICALAALSTYQCASVCKTSADIALILDASGSLGTANYNKALQFLKNLVDTFSIAKDQVRVGVIVYSSSSSIKLKLDKYTTKDSLKKAIGQLPYFNGYTNTPAALMDTINLLTSGTYGGRQDPVPSIAIIITDGNHNRGNLNAAVTELRKSNIEVFAVGVGGRIKSSELNLVASQPSSSHVFTVQEYSQLQGKLGTLGQTVCPSKHTEDTGGLNELANPSYLEEDPDNIDNTENDYAEETEEEEMREESMEDLSHISEDE